MEEILRRKAAQGVDVRLIYDDFGSLLGLPKDFVVRMERRTSAASRSTRWCRCSRW